MVERWTDGDMTKFLEVYQQKEILWNPKLELYRNNAARIAALDEIIHSLQKPNLTPNDLKIKIKNIRTTYNRELSKLLKSKKSGAGANDIYKPALRWFEQADTFLRPVTETRPSKSNLMKLKTNNSAKKSTNTNKNKSPKKQAKGGVQVRKEKQKDIVKPTVLKKEGEKIKAETPPNPEKLALQELWSKAIQNVSSMTNLSEEESSIAKLLGDYKNKSSIPLKSKKLKNMITKGFSKFKDTSDEVLDGVYEKLISEFKAVGGNVDSINKDTKVRSKKTDSKTLKSKKEDSSNDEEVMDDDDDDEIAKGLEVDDDDDDDDDDETIEGLEVDDDDDDDEEDEDEEEKPKPKAKAGFKNGKGQPNKGKNGSKFKGGKIQKNKKFNKKK